MALSFVESVTMIQSTSAQKTEFISKSSTFIESDKYKKVFKLFRYKLLIY